MTDNMSGRGGVGAGASSGLGSSNPRLGLGPGAGTPGPTPNAAPSGGANPPPPPPPPPPGAGGTTPPPSGGGQNGPRYGATPLSSAIIDLAKSAAQNGASSQVTDAITQAMLAILGSGPSIAAFESLMSINAANGMMYYNAVDHQQKTNLLGMAMTAKCVRYMLDPPNYDGFSEVMSGAADPASRG